MSRKTCWLCTKFLGIWCIKWQTSLKDFQFEWLKFKAMLLYTIRKGIKYA